MEELQTILMYQESKLKDEERTIQKYNKLIAEDQNTIVLINGANACIQQLECLALTGKAMIMNENVLQDLDNNKRKYYDLIKKYTEDITIIRERTQRQMQKIEQYQSIRREIQLIASNLSHLREEEVRSMSHNLLASIVYTPTVRDVMARIQSGSRYRIDYDHKRDTLDVYFTDFSFPDRIYFGNEFLASKITDIKMPYYFDKHNYHVKLTFRDLNQMCLRYMNDCVTNSLNGIEQVFSIDPNIAKIRVYLFNSYTWRMFYQVVNGDVIAMNPRGLYSYEKNEVNLVTWSLSFDDRGMISSFYPDTLAIHLTPKN
jgi:hypothetical protein